MSIEIYLSSDEKIALANSWDDAAKSLYQQGISSAITLESCKWLTTTEQDSLITSITADKFRITTPTKTALLGFLAECKKTPNTVAPAASVTTSTNSPLAWSAELRIAMKTKYDDREYLSKWYVVLGRIPGFEVGWIDDVKDALYQSHANMLKYVSWLETEYANPSKDINTGSFDAGLYPFFFDKTKFDTVTEKQAYILRMIKDLKDVYTNTDKIVDQIITYFSNGAKGVLSVWTATVVGILLATMWIKFVLTKKFGGWWVSVIDAGKEGWKWFIWKAVGIADNITGMKWRVARAAVKGTVWGVVGSVVGQPILGAIIWAGRWALQWSKNPDSHVLLHATSDTPPYSQEEWKKERARLEETTRRMIYTDSSLNPGHNRNATSAEIFAAVESNPALRTAYDARMVKLTELGNTLVGQDKYLAKKAYDAEVERIVAGDIGDKSLVTRVKSELFITTEAKEAKAIKVALKKVKGEIATMRTALEAHKSMSGVDAPEALKSQLEAFDQAYTTAYNSDVALDKARNDVTKIKKQFQVAGELIGHLAEIERLESMKTSKADMDKLKDAAATDTGAEVKEAAVVAEVENVEHYEKWLSDAKEAFRKHHESIMPAEEKVTEAKNAIKAKRKELQDWIDKSNDGRTENGISKSNKAIEARKIELQKVVDYDGADSTNPEKVKAKTEAEELIKYINNPIDPVPTELSSLYNDLNTAKASITKWENLIRDIDAKNHNLELDALFQAVDDAESKVNRLTTDTTYQDALNEAKVKVDNAVADRKNARKLAKWVDAQRVYEASKSENEAIDTKIKEERLKMSTAIDANELDKAGFSKIWDAATLKTAYERKILDMTNNLDASVPTSLEGNRISLKRARDIAWTNLNTARINLNTEAARLNPALKIEVPHIAEFVKGQHGHDLATRENGTTGDKAEANKLKPKANPLKTIITGTRH